MRYDVGGGGSTMNKEPSDFPNGHYQNDHFDYNHNTIFINKWSWLMVKWSQLTDISTDFSNKIICNRRNTMTYYLYILDLTGIGAV